VITPGEYDEQEQKAKVQFPVLYEDQKWSVEDSEEWASHLDFPLRIKDFSELGCLLNRFQRGRYEGYMAELDGLTDKEIDQFKNAIHKIEILGTQYLKNYDIPLDQLMSALAIHRKIRIAKQGPISILEVGPGAGLTSLFFSQDPEIINYTQIETCQSLYLLQELVNEISGMKVNHLTWWQEVPKIQYDVITANACLAEMTDRGLERYLDIFDQRSHDKTLLLVQCPGGEVSRTEQDVLKLIKHSGWFFKRESVWGDPILKTWWFSRTDAELNFNYDEYPDRQMYSKLNFMKIRPF
jgi:hypothetical protein